MENKKAIEILEEVRESLLDDLSEEGTFCSEAKTVIRGHYEVKQEYIEALNKAIEDIEIPEIPEVVADYIETTRKRKKNILGLLYDAKTNREVYDWCIKVDGSLTFITLTRAWILGYTIEPEPTYVIKTGAGYFNDFVGTGVNESGKFICYVSPDKKTNGVMLTTDKDKADAIATLVHGTVESYWENEEDTK